VESTRCGRGNRHVGIGSTPDVLPDATCVRCIDDDSLTIIRRDAEGRREGHVLLLGVTLTALALLFMLSSLALATAGELSHPRTVAALLLAVLVVGLLLLSE
jgi:hypothetical protein